MSSNQFCLLFKRIWEREERFANAKLSDYDLTFTQSNALEYIVENDSITQKNLEEHMEIQHSAVVGIVSRLESKGMIISTNSRQDRRQKLLFPTKLGLQVLEDIRADKERVENTLLKGLSEEDCAQLEHLLTRVYQNLAEG